MKAGDTYGEWTLLAPAEPDRHGGRRWLCRCSCTDPTERPVYERALKTGRSTSCGGRHVLPTVQWSEALIEQRLRVHAKVLDRMPTYNELVEMEGSNGLAAAISKRQGYRAWATRLGLKQKGGATHRGQRWEFSEQTFFEGLGHEVEKQTTKAEFDLLVNHHRVDVKSATWTECRQKSGKNKGNVIRGYVFAGLKRGAHCDFFDLLCIEDDQVKHRYIVPSSKAAVVSLTITQRTLGGYGKYSAFLDQVNLLE